MSKVAVIGAGFVGSTSAYAMMLQGTCSEIVLLDMDEQRAAAEAADIAHGTPLAYGTRVRAGGYSDLKGASVVVIAAGSNQKPGESRLDLLARNAKIFAAIVPQVVAVAPKAVLVIASNPVDIMTAVTKALHPHPELVLGSGTILDSARFRQLVAEKAQVNAKHVNAYVVGEHGDSSVCCWSSTYIGGLHIDTYMKERGFTFTAKDKSAIEDNVRRAAAIIIAGKKATYYGIGVGVAKIVEMIINDRRSVYTVATNSLVDDVCLSLPCVIGAGGVQARLMSQLDHDETIGLARSAEILLDAQDGVLKDGKLLV